MKQLNLVLSLLVLQLNLCAQSDSTTVKRIPVDTNKLIMNMDAVYNRPLLQLGRVPIAIGGYVESNSSYFATNGQTEGLSFQIPRLTFILSSSIKNRIKFLTEIEIADGGKNIGVDFAAMDITLHKLINLRGGIILNPIGSFNQNHDSPKWEFISRPISSTTIIPGVWNNVGFGIYGKIGDNNVVWGYEACITNGFDDRIIANDQSRTWLVSSKQNPDRFTNSFNGIPLLTAKTAIRHRTAGEIGISWMGGVYNKFEENGLTIDKQRRIDLIAFDFNTTLPKLNTHIEAEWVWVMIDVPSTYTQQFGDAQKGGFIDIIQPILHKNIFGWQDAILNLNWRTEFSDYNVGTFTETGENISDHIIAIIPGISFRPSTQTVIKANYRYHWQWDLFGNPPSRTAGFQFGFATYV